MTSAQKASKDLTKSAGRRGYLTFRPGFVIALEFSATGGTRYRRAVDWETREGAGLQAQFTTTKDVDNVELNKTSRQIINQAYHVLDKHCTHTPIGYWADAETRALIVAELAPIREAADAFNATARACGSARRVEISIYPLELSENNEDAARRIARDVRDRLAEMRDALRAGDRKAFELAADKARNLDRMATGIQADSIRMALESAKVQKTQLLEALRNGFTAEDAAPHLDLEAIDACISLFTDPAEAAEAAAVLS